MAWPASGRADDWADSLFAQARAGLLRRRDDRERFDSDRQWCETDCLVHQVCGCAAASVDRLGSVPFDDGLPAVPRLPRRSAFPAPRDASPRHALDRESAHWRDWPLMGTRGRSEVFDAVVSTGVPTDESSAGAGGFSLGRPLCGAAVDTCPRCVEDFRQNVLRLERRVDAIDRHVSTMLARLESLETSVAVLRFKSVEQDSDEPRQPVIEGGKTRELRGRSPDGMPPTNMDDRFENMSAQLRAEVDEHVQGLSIRTRAQADEHLWALVAQLDGHIEAAAAQIDAFVGKAETQLVGSAQRAAHLVHFQGPEHCTHEGSVPQDRCVPTGKQPPPHAQSSRIFPGCVEDNGVGTGDSCPRVSNPSAGAFTAAEDVEVAPTRRDCTSVDVPGPDVAIDAGGSQFLHSGPSDRSQGALSALASTVAAAAEAAAAPPNDPLSSPSVLKARMAALLTQVAELLHEDAS